MESEKLNSVLEKQVLEIQSAMEEQRREYIACKSIISKAISPLVNSEKIDFNPEGTLLHNFFDYSAYDPDGGVYCLFYFKQLGMNQVEDLSISHIDINGNEYFKLNIQTTKLTGGRYNSSINTYIKKGANEIKCTIDKNQNLNLAKLTVDSFNDAFNLAS